MTSTHADLAMSGELELDGTTSNHRTSFGTAALEEEEEEEDLDPTPRTLMIENFFCGRDAEILKLEGIFRRTAASRGKVPYPNLVLVGGASGAGKSTLVTKLKEHLGAIEEELFWISGKFEEGQQQQTLDIDDSDDCSRHEVIDGGDVSQMSSASAGNRDSLHPYTAIVDAFQTFCEVLEEEEPETIEDVKADILEAVGPQAPILTSMIPSLTKIIGEQEAMGESQPSDAKRFHLVFKNFLQALASQVRSVVLVLDDFHCADAASLELLKYLMTSELKHVLFIGTYRSSQVCDDSHRFNRWINSVQEMQAQEYPPDKSQSTASVGSSTITKMELSAMDLETITSLVSDILSLPPDQTRSLAHIIYTKTEGNAFFATQYLLFLNNRQLLWYNKAQKQWAWDEEAIRKEAAVTTSLIDFMREKMLTSRVAPKILPVAACLGAKFSQQTLEMILEDISKIEALQDVLLPDADDNNSGNDNYDVSKGVDNLLKLCHKEGFIQQVGNRQYSFAHDKMQEAALTLHPAKTMQQIRYEAGGTLFRKLGVQELEEKLFVIVNLLNTSRRTSVSQFEIAQLNLEAAKKARQMGAFGSAATYLEYALFFLPPRQKETQYEAHRNFLWEVCSHGAEVERATGRMDKMKEYVDRLVRSTFQYDIFEQLRVQNVLIDCSANMGGQMDLALKYCFAVMEELGCTFPRTTFGKGLKSVSALLKSKAPRNIPKLEDVANMDLMTDPAKVESMRLLDRAATYAYLMDNQLVFIMCTTRMVRWTIRFGVCDKSPAAYALLGVVLMHILGDYKAGVWHGQLALLMIKKLSESQPGNESERGILTQSESRATFIAIGMIIFWSKPLREYKDEMIRGYEVGMQMGDIESAIWNAYQHVAIKFAAGTPLKTLEKLIRSVVAETQALNRDEQEAYARIPWQGILSLMKYTQEEGTSELVGTAIKEADWLEKQGEGASKLIAYNFSHMRTVVCAFLGDYEAGAKIAIERGDYFLNAAPGHPWGLTDPFVRGVCLYAAASSTKQRMYKQHGQKCRTTLRTWVKKGNPTAVHYLKLLDAEHEAFAGRRDTAKALYEEACNSASEGGFVQDAALANERYANFLSSSENREDAEESRIRLVRALSLYEEWGAKAKVDRILVEHPSFSTSKTSRTSAASSHEMCESCPLEVQ